MRVLSQLLLLAISCSVRGEEAGAPGGRYGRESLYSSGHDPSPGLAPEGELFPSRSSYSLSSARAASDHTFPEVRVGHRNLSNSARGGASGLPVWGGSR